MENMHCSADDAVLDRARHAAVTVADIARLEQNREASLDTARVAAVLIDPKSILIAKDNATGDTVNSLRATHGAVTSNKTLYVFMANDWPTVKHGKRGRKSNASSGRSLSPATRQSVDALSVMDSAKRPTLLFGYVGMPGSLLDNQCCVKKGGVTLGAANGVGAIWLKPVVDGEPSVERGAIKYYPRPSLCLFVQLQDPARRCSRLVDGFPDGVVCCRPSNDTIEHPSVATTPDIAVHRRQIQ